MNPQQSIVPYCLLAYLLFTISQQSQGQMLQDSGRIYTEVATIISNMPSSTGNDYADPDSVQLSQWGNLLGDLLDEDYALAANTANTLGYDLVEFLDTTFSPNRTYYVLSSYPKETV